MSHTIHVTSRTDLQRHCDTAGRPGLLQFRLFRAAAGELLPLIIICYPSAAWPAALIESNANLPTCVLIGADLAAPRTKSCLPNGPTQLNCDAGARGLSFTAQPVWSIIIARPPPRRLDGTGASSSSRRLPAADGNIAYTPLLKFRSREQ